MRGISPPASVIGEARGDLDLSPMNLTAVVLHYRRWHQARSKAELDLFAAEASLARAVRRAALAKTPSGKRYPHQRRRKSEALKKGAEKLASVLSKIDAATNFAKLLAVVNDAVRTVSDLGELYVYDTALRIGAYKGILPTRVYLHAGTREGAKALELDFERRRVALDTFEVPEPLRALAPHELEDVLCIYKRYFSGERADLDETEGCWVDDGFKGC